MRVLGIALLGVSTGLQYGLLAMGLVLVYRASRLVNMAQGQLGIFAAIVLARLVVEGHLPYALALPVALAVGALTGVAVERGVIQRLFDASRLVLLIATIALTQGLFAVTQFKGLHVGSTRVLPASPLLLDQGKVEAYGGYPVPFHGRLTVGGVVLDGAQLLSLVVAPAIAVGFSFVFARTALGRRIRAASSNPEAARLAGVSVRRVSLLVWVVAAVLSGLAAILSAPAQPTVTAALQGPGLLLRGLAAALLAGFVDFRIAFVGGVAVGLLEQTAQYNLHTRGITDLAVVLVLLVGIVLRGSTIARSFRAGDDRLVVELSRPPLSAAARQHWLVRNVDRSGWVLLTAVLLVLPVLPGLTTQAKAQALTQILTIALLGVSLLVLTGWAGQVSLGQWALMGIGAFAAAHVVAVHHWGFVAVLLFSGVVTAGAGVLIGLPAVRLRGVFLAVTTLALAVLGASWLFYQQEVGADAAGAATLPLAQVATPLGGALHSYRELYYVTLVVLGLAILSVRALRRSGPGRALVAARDNERAASASGVSVLGARLTALAISGFLAGVAGALWAMSQTVFSAAAFDAGHSLLMLSVAIVGGMGGLAGPVLGAFAVFGWPFLVPGQNNVLVQSLFSTVLLLVVLLRRPGGLVSLVESVRRRLVSSVADGPTPLADEPAAPQPAAEDELPAATASARFAPVPGSRPLVVEDLAISFGGVRALDGVTLTVGPGEIVGLIGGNGAGKTTLMNCVSGHLRPTSGRVELFGQDVTDLPPQFRPVLSVARSFQDAALYPGLTVLETAMVPMDGRDRSGTVGALLGAPWTVAGERRKQAAAMSVLSTFGLGDRAATLTSELSTGMRRLVDFSAIVAARPALVLLDEPTAGIAQREVEEFGALLRDLRESLDCAIVLIEHDMPLVMSVCDRVYCLSSGSVVAEGTPEQVQTDPAVIASYLGTDQAAIARSGAST